jgi:glycosyltransferase involved in cell wall biosynthesis
VGVTRILFLNQGQAVKKSALGHVRVQQLLQAHVARGGDVQARFRTMEPFNLWQRALVTPIPGLPGRGYSDYRWFAVQGLAARRVIRQELETWKPTVAHVTSNDVALLLPSMQKSLPCVPSFDVTISDWMRMMYRIGPDSALAHPWKVLEDAERHAVTAAPLTIAWTANVTRQLHSLAPTARIETLHPGLDLDLFTPRQGKRRPGALRILFVGGRFKAKGGPALLEAAAQLARPVEVHVVTTEAVPAHPLMTVHRARPGTSDLADLFRDADLFCLPTTFDAVPWVVLEAQASGLPVVSTAVGSIPEMLPPDCGRVVPPGDPSALKSALDELVGDAELLTSMGAAARRNVVANYDASRNTARLTEMLSEVART